MIEDPTLYRVNDNPVQSLHRNTPPKAPIMLNTLSFTRADGITSTFPIVWIDHAVSVGGEWSTTPAPALLPEHDEALSDFAGYDVLQTIVYLWIDGNGITSATVDSGTYTLSI